MWLHLSPTRGGHLAISARPWAARAGVVMVGARGFEPPTPSSRTMCATRLRYAPTEGGPFAGLAHDSKGPATRRSSIPDPVRGATGEDDQGPIVVGTSASLTRSRARA